MSTLVIDGEVFGINHETSGTEFSIPTPEKDPWNGFETVFANNDYLAALVDRASLISGSSLDGKSMAAMFYENQFQRLWDELNAAIGNFWKIPNGRERLSALSYLISAQALILMHYDDYPSARITLEKAVHLDPSNAPSRLLLAEALAGEGDFRQAQQVVEPLLHQGPHPVRLSALLSLIAQHNALMEKALYHWNRVMEQIRPSQADEFRRKFLEAEVFVEKRFRTYSTQKYIIRYESVFEDRKDKVLGPVMAMVDEASTILNKRFGMRPDNRTLIILYSEPTMNRLIGEIFPMMEAFFSLEDSNLRISIRSEYEEDIRVLRPIIIHECVHRLIHYKTGGRLRIRWFHEGMASWYEKAETGQDRFAEFARSSMENTVDIRTLMRDEVSPYSYYQARLVIEYMMTRFGEVRIMKFLDRIGEGAGLNEALEEALGMNYDRLAETVVRDVKPACF